MNTSSSSTTTTSFAPLGNVLFKFTKSESDIRHFRILKTNDNQLYASGSGQFSVAHLHQMEEKIGKVKKQAMPILIINLREESSGFINEKPVVWKNDGNDLNKGRNVAEIEADETLRLTSLKGKTVQVAKGKSSHLITLQVAIDTAYTERELIKEKGFQYYRLPVTSNHAPLDKEVDEFVRLLKDNPETWIHLHCYVGKRRTSTFLAMYHMYHEASHRTFDEILQRQVALGGSDLKDKKEGSKLNEEAEKRLVFLNAFYLYCKEKSEKSWSEWSKNQVLV